MAGRTGARTPVGTVEPCLTTEEATPPGPETERVTCAQDEGLIQDGPFALVTAKRN